MTVKKEETEIIESIFGSAGVMSTVAKRLGCDWHTAKKLVDSSEETKIAYRNEKEKILDLAESKIIEAVNMGDINTAKWYLGLIGRKRGYGDRVDVGFTGGQLPVNIKIVGVDGNKDTGEA